MDHLLRQSLDAAVINRAGAVGVKHDVEGSRFALRRMRRFDARGIEQTTACKMARPD
jgi:branched-chain amino acid transport system substrate-binding protein